ncbi:MAG: ferredoxin:thioredoxin reductase [Promethearchaeota archaeon]|nr:MAG: ferredoxin:thioredoxin reductase [Candidatus Lokiarchaeota archaeon]
MSEEMDMETKEGMMEYCKKVADTNDWILNKDEQTLQDLIDGLVDNKKNLGYQSCPCRFACGKRELDRDLICPCEYAPADVKEYGTCYCNLYMRKDFYETIDQEYVQVPERRPIEKEEAALDYVNESLE